MNNKKHPGCERCGFKGWTETVTIRSGGEQPIVLQCNSCRDTAAYTAEIKRRMDIRKEQEKLKTQMNEIQTRKMAKVLPFPSSKK